MAQGWEQMCPLCPVGALVQEWRIVKCMRRGVFSHCRWKWECLSHSSPHYVYWTLPNCHHFDRTRTPSQTFSHSDRAGSRASNTQRHIRSILLVHTSSWGVCSVHLGRPIYLQLQSSSSLTANTEGFTPPPVAAAFHPCDNTEESVIGWKLQGVSSDTQLSV